MWILAWCKDEAVFAEVFPIELNSEVRRKHSSIAVKRSSPISLDFGVEEVVYQFKVHYNCSWSGYAENLSKLRIVMQKAEQYDSETSLVSIVDKENWLFDGYSPVSVYPELNWKEVGTDDNGNKVYEMDEYLAPANISVRRESGKPGRVLVDLAFRAGLANCSRTIRDALDWIP